MPLTALADLPFVEREPWSLLGLDPAHTDRDPDRDHVEFGFCHLAAVRLEDPGDRALSVERPLVLALHTREDPEPLPDTDADIELEFILHDEHGEYSAVARLSEFLRRRLPPLLLKDPRPAAVVLALCNPLRTVLPDDLIRPVLGDLPLYYGHGDVTAWMQRRPGARAWTPDTVDIILTAEQWHRIGPGIAR